MAQVMSLSQAVAEFVSDDQEIALEGFTHLIPSAAGHEIIRQGRKGLVLIRLTPDVIYDQMIGAGCARKLVFSWGGNPGVGSLHRFRDSVENRWPAPIDLEEHTHAGMTARYVTGASGIPFGVIRGYVGTDLASHTRNVSMVECPFTREELAAVRALNPDVTIIHAQQADRHGNVMLWGIVGVQKEAALAAARTIVTVEEIVDSFEPRLSAVVIPSWVLDAICVVPGGTHPSYALGYSQRDNEFYRRWNEISRDRKAFRAWLERHIFGTSGFPEFIASINDTDSEGE